MDRHTLPNLPGPPLEAVIKSLIGERRGDNANLGGARICRSCCKCSAFQEWSVLEMAEKVCAEPLKTEVLENRLLSARKH